MKGVPEAEQEKLIALVSDNPEFFQTLALEIQTKMKGGKDQTVAAMEVLAAHKSEIEELTKKIL